MSSMNDLRTELKESIEERIEYLVDGGDVLRTDTDKMQELMHDSLHEIVDGCIPVYTSELMELAREDCLLATEEPETWGFGGEHSPLNGIVGNLYQKLMEWASEILEEIIEEMEEEDADE